MVTGAIIKARPTSEMYAPVIIAAVHVALRLVGSKRMESDQLLLADFEHIMRRFGRTS